MPNFVSLTQPNLQILDKSCRNKHVRNSRTSNYIDMKLGPVTKLDERNTTSSKKFDDDLVSVSFSQLMVDFGANRNPDSGRMVYNSYIFINIL